MSKTAWSGQGIVPLQRSSNLAKPISPAMNLRVIKSLATPSCSLVFTPAMGISTSSDFGRVETSNEHSTSLSSSQPQHPTPRTFLSSIIIIIIISFQPSSSQSPTTRGLQSVLFAIHHHNSSFITFVIHISITITEGYTEQAR